ncbi:MAG: transcription-repair coupling factor, partial [Cyanobium sp.]
VQSLRRLLELKLLAQRCGVSRIKPDKPNILLETPMEEPAFRLLRQGLPTHLHGRLVYQAGSAGAARIVARGLGALPADKQVEELMDWLEKMAAQIPSPQGTAEDQPPAQSRTADSPVLVV